MGLWACGACTASAPVQVEAPDAAALVFALLDGDGRVRAVQVQPADQLQPFSVPLDLAYPLVSFALRPSDFLYADGRPVSAEHLQDLSIRVSTAPSEEGRGACGRCLEPPASGLQVVHSGDACPPRLEGAVAYRADAGRLEAVPSDRAEADVQEVLQGVASQLRFDWPGACAAQPREFLTESAPVLQPISPPADPWPVRAVAQHTDGTLGLFTEGRHSVHLPDGQEISTDSEPTPGRPRAAASLPAAGQGPRFLVAFDQAMAGQPELTDFRIFEVQDGQLRSSPALVEGVFEPEGFQLSFAAWLPVGAGQRLALGGARGQRPELWFCDVAAQGLSCSASALSHASCDGAGALRGLVNSDRGWFGVAERAYVQAPPGATLPEDWRCHAPKAERITVRTDDDAIEVQPQLRSVGLVGRNVVVCAEPEDWDNRAIILQADLGTQTPFDGTALSFSLVSGASIDRVRCGEFTPPPDQLEVAEPDRLRLDLMSFLMDISADRSLQAVDDVAYRAESLGRPHTRLIQRAPGWLVQYTGWAIEPRPLGAGIMLRSAQADWRVVRGDPAVSDLVEVVARETDLVAFAAFTNRAPYRMQLSDAASGAPAEFEVMTQEPASELERGVREGVQAALYDERSGEIYLAGNNQVAADGQVADTIDLAWRPFLRRVSPELTFIQDLPLPLEAGQYLCAGARLGDDAFIFVGGQGALIIYDGVRVRTIDVDYDDARTAEVERAPRALNTGQPQPHFLSVDAAEGVAWVGGDRGLVVRIARERVGTGIDWKARRIALSRVGPAGLRTPLLEVARFTHVVAHGPDHATFVAQRRPFFVDSGCAQVHRTRTLKDLGDLVEIGPAEAVGSSWPLVWRTWPHADLFGQIPEFVSGGLQARAHSLLTFEWAGVIRGSDGVPQRLPFYPAAAARAPDGRWVVVGPNHRVAVSTRE